MKQLKPASSSRAKSHRLVFIAALVSLVIPCIYLALLKPKLDPLNLQLSVKTNIKIQVVKENTSFSDRQGTKILKTTLEENQNELQLKIDDVQAIEMPRSAAAEENIQKTVSEKQASESSISCDFSHPRSDTCLVHGDVRVIGDSASIIVAKFSQENSWDPGQTLKVRPYARKWEPPVMQLIREFTLKSSSKHEEILQCRINHTVPAIIFSTGGFSGNFFHAFTDILVPLFTTSYRYKGEVQFLVTNYNSRWIKKYEVILKQLSYYEIINLDRDGKVHCYQDVQVGLTSHEDLIIDPTKSPNGHSMIQFRQLLRKSFSLNKNEVRIGHQKPRLLLMYRKGSRSLINRRQVVSLARSLGYNVVLAGPEHTKNLSNFVHVVNSCDVMMGVHGAGLTNMIFLPDNATIIQVIPWGGLKYACSHDFGDPAPGMRLNYLEYEIREEESSLIKQYPRNHPVFKDPMSIHRQGWNVLWSVFLNKQSIKLDVRRFKGILQQALQTLPR